MRLAPWPIVSAALICGLFVGCSPNKGPATNAYLRGYMQASENLKAQLRQLPPVNPPQRPTPEPRRTFKQRSQKYPAELNQYYDSFIARGHVLENLYGQTQSQIAALNGAGVEASVLEMVTVRERTLGQRREVFVEMGRLAELNKQHRSDGLDELIGNVLSGALKAEAATLDPSGASALAGAAKGLAAFAVKQHAEKEAIGEQANLLAASSAELQRDLIEYQTAFAQVRTTLPAKYSNQDWSFLGPSKAVSAAQ